MTPTPAAGTDRDIRLLNAGHVLALQAGVGNQAVSRLSADLDLGDDVHESATNPYEEPTRFRPEAHQGDFRFHTDELCIQREEVSTHPAQVWQVPTLFGGESCNNGGDASAKLVDINDQLEPLKDEFDGIPAVVEVIHKLNLTIDGTASGPLTSGLATELGTAGLAAEGAYNVALNQYKAAFENSIKANLEYGQTYQKIAADMLNSASFGKDADVEVLEAAKDACESVHEFGEWTLNLNEWVVTALKAVQSAHKFQEALEVFESFGEIGEKASVVVAGLISAFDTYSAISASNDPTKTDTQKEIAALKAGFSTVPAVCASAGTLASAASLASLMSAATGVGLVFTTLSPQLEAGLHMLGEVDSMVATWYKTNVAAYEWWQQARMSSGTPPQIPPRMKGTFPGDQETLNFMWAVFRGNPPEQAPASVEKFFYDEREKFNKGHTGDELETEWHLLPWVANEVKNLIPWVQDHKEEVWAMLYGSLTHP